ncbi:MAG: ROK family protein [Candidatus Melainabacteria bacterium]|nr:ROK family protein [Candidatus Melainabacteria bacterium]MBI3308211.1 ROK family protein [Candidatus Melainabacteria bacterium]
MGIVIESPSKRAVRNQLYLGVDVGGTNVRAAAYPLRHENVEGAQAFTTSLKANDYPSLKDALVEVMEIAESIGVRNRITGMGFGIAGPLDGSKVKLTNHAGWKEIDLNELAQEFGVKVGGLNDLEATSWGIVSGLKASDVEVLQKGKPDFLGDEAIIAPGTGLGEGRIIERKYPRPSEGGHSDFAPKGEEQKALLSYLEELYGEGKVTYEDVLSGQGLVDIAYFLAKLNGEEYDEGLGFDQGMSTEVLATKIAKQARTGTHQLSMNAMNIYTDVLAQEASNLAVKEKATGGIYLGGTTKHDLPFILGKRSRFLHIFQAKRKPQGFLPNVPLAVITKDDINQLGAAYFIGHKPVKISV